MPISKDEFRSIDEDGPSLPDLAPDTTQGAVYRFLLEHADQAFRQREIVDAVDVPEGSVGPTLKRLEEHGLVEHRDRFWTIADAEHAVASAGIHGAATADDIDGGFSDDDVEAWMETAVDPIDSTTDQADEES
ncbi:MarR family transcriptional regulator [Halorarius halobius]|uniref:MarR family transcriptional regulator n=1 Tax=Halorarius halobius TaxID=2962671 RepID=UPI0020CCCFD7|nr:MarR family transcriptional regulator [Halorarius halobius]